MEDSINLKIVTSNGPHSGGGEVGGSGTSRRRHGEGDMRDERERESDM